MMSDHDQILQDLLDSLDNPEDFRAGTPEADSFFAGTLFPLTALGLGGRDILIGRGLDDVLVGGAAADFLEGRAGDDLLLGGTADDVLDAGAGADLAAGGRGADVILGGRGFDTLIGDEGRDTLNGGLGRDIIKGGKGGDEIFALDGPDTVYGGEGRDLIHVGDDRSVIYGGLGTDTLSVEGLLSDYTYTTRSDGRILIEAKNGSANILADDVEFITDSVGGTSRLDGPVTLQLLHASDLEGNADAVENAPNFAAIVDTLEDTYATTLLISSGDNYIPSPFSNAAGTSNPEVEASLEAVLNDVYTQLLGETFTNLQTDPGRIDITIMNILGFDASAIGNHEFDFGQQQFADVIGPEAGGAPGQGDDPWVGAQFPYLSANIEIEPESVLAPLVDADGILPSEPSAGVIAPFTVIEENGETFGVIGATTQLLQSLSSTFGDPDNPNDDVNAPPGEDDMAALAAVIQPIIDALQDNGVNKIILTSHLQQFALEKELAGLLNGIDIIIAGGSDTLLADSQDRLREDDEAAETYPFITKDAGGNDVAIVSTDGQYAYLGRLVVEFDAGGNLIADSIDENVSGAFATDEQGVLDVTGASDLESAIEGSEKASLVQDLVDVISEGVLEVSGRNFFADQVDDLNGERDFGVRTEETNLGNLTADANLAIANELSDEPVLVSLKNGGGIRSSIPNDDGKISELEIQQTLAFNNTLTLITLTPDQLLDVINHGVAESTYDADGNPTNTQGRFPQVGGVEFSFDPDLTAGSRVQDVVIKNAGPNGEDVKIFEDGAATSAADDFASGIRVVTLNFLVGGGDGYPYPDFVAANPDFADVEDLFQPDIIADGNAQFTNVGTEQDALAEFLFDNFPPDDAPGNDFGAADTPAVEDTRIINLAIPGATDIDLL